MKTGTRYTRTAVAPNAGKPGQTRTAEHQARPAAHASPRTNRSLAQDERRRMIAEAAYFKAAERGFQGGSADQDWLEAEVEIDAMILRMGGPAGP